MVRQVLSYLRENFWKITFSLIVIDHQEIVGLLDSEYGKYGFINIMRKFPTNSIRRKTVIHRKNHYVVVGATSSIIPKIPSKMFLTDFFDYRQ